MDSITQRLADLRRQIQDACLRAGRPADAAALVAVSKAVSVERLLEAARAGQRHFGESYAQEALDKRQALLSAGQTPLILHFIGSLQANKSRAVAENFDWVHSVDREAIIQRLADQRPPGLSPLNVCIQVNLTAQPGRAGCAPEVAPGLCEQVAQSPRLAIRGLMILPPANVTPEQSLEIFQSLRGLHAHIRSIGRVDRALFDTLSMGMSGDFQSAIEAGATFVRIGTALFGPRA